MPELEPPANPFDEFLQRRWAKLGLTQAQFAEKLGQDRSRISQIRRYHETGKTPPLDEMPLWAKAMSIEVGTPVYETMYRLALLAHANRELAALIQRYENERAESQLRDREQSKKISDLSTRLQRIEALLAERDRGR